MRHPKGVAEVDLWTDATTRDVSTVIRVPSPPPLEPGALYHVFNRGTNGENLFREDRNCEYFMQLLVFHTLSAVDLYAYCLMRNHFHLVIRVKSEDELRKTLRVSERRPAGRCASQVFSNMFNAYTKTINKTYGRTGSLFEHPFHRVKISGDGHLQRAIVYVHRNPVKHGFVANASEWQWSSYHVLLSRRPTRMMRDDVLDHFGGSTAFTEAHVRLADDVPLHVPDLL